MTTFSVWVTESYIIIPRNYNYRNFKNNTSQPFLAGLVFTDFSADVTALYQVPQEGQLVKSVHHNCTCATCAQMLTLEYYIFLKVT